MKAKRTPLQPARSADEWTPVTPREWAKSLERARGLALRRQANVGLDMSADSSDIGDVASMILCSPLGADLVPRLAACQAKAKALVESFRNPQVRSGEDDDFDDPGAVLFSYYMAIADASFLFGLIAGTQTTWPVVAALKPPCRPPMRKGKA
ncbi:MAG: hypothetical protein ABJA98_17540 [Acidobacteriota bacterium]